MNLNIVLFEPEIPQNTGNIARTCVGFNAKLHLIRPYGFSLFSKQVKRSCVDYWSKLALFEYNSWDEFIEKRNKNDQFFFITRYGRKTLTNITKNNLKNNIFLIFGKESTGVPIEILKKHRLNCYRIPTSKNVRALNVSNCVAICAYYMANLNNFSGLEKKEPFKKSI